jgi:hypothetical protein
LSGTCADLGMKFQDPSSLGLTMLGRRTEGNGCGYWPTACANEGRNRHLPDGKRGWGLEYAAKLWPTPRSGKTTDEKEEAWTARQEAGKVSTPPLTLAVKMWPTPKGSPSGPDFARMSREGSGGDDLVTMVNRGGGRPTLPTPSASMVTMQDMEQAKFAGSADRPKYADCPGGALNPEWVEWLMGWPIGWNDLKPLEMARFRKWLQQHGRF